MRRLGLSTLLIAFNVATAILAVTVVGIGGTALLRHLAEDQALAHVRQSSAEAARAVEGAGRRLATSALLLAERPTLARLVREADRPALARFLESFCTTSHLDGCEVYGGPSLLAHYQGSSDARAMVGADLASDGDAPPGWFLHEDRDTGKLWLAAAAPVAEIPAARVCVTQALDEAAGEPLGETDPSVTVYSVDGAAARAARPGGELGMRAAEGLRGAAAKVAELRAFVGTTPIFDSTGRPVAVTEARFSTALAAPSLGGLVRTLIGLACAAAACAALVGLFLSRSVARPVEQLAQAAMRIGGGDLASPVAVAGGTVIATLAEAMEEMRGRILTLTTELRRRQAEAEAVLTGIVEGVYAVGRARRIRYLNPQAAALLGIRPEDAIGRFCGDVLNPRGSGGKRPCEDRCPIVHARFRGSARAIEELQLPNGRRRTVVITSSPAGPADENGAVHQFQVIRDETEVETSRRLRDMVLANISHEFRTPLSAQLASLELLLDRLDELPPAQQRELICSVQRATVRLTRLVDNLLEGTRIEAGAEGLRHGPVALDEVVEEAVEAMGPLLRQRGQRLRIHLPHPLPAISGDAPRLVQVFVNLLANANKFAPADSEIVVGGRLIENEIELWVADEGPGLPPGIGEDVFQRFVRSAEEEPEASGMGLGLFIVKSIVERHGGRVKAESTGRGTRMRVILPRQGQPRRAEDSIERSDA
ncbi:MAG: ATP-binding protein [Candidatus Eisenbacteria bacterium]